MISMRANPLLGPLEGVGPGNLGFFLAQMALAEDMKTKAKKEKSWRFKKSVRGRAYVERTINKTISCQKSVKKYVNESIEHLVVNTHLYKPW